MMRERMREVRKTCCRIIEESTDEDQLQNAAVSCKLMLSALEKEADTSNDYTKRNIESMRSMIDRVMENRIRAIHCSGIGYTNTIRCGSWR